MASLWDTQCVGGGAVRRSCTSPPLFCARAGCHVVPAVADARAEESVLNAPHPPSEQAARQKEDETLQTLQERITSLPAIGSAEQQALRFFRELPISPTTLTALKDAGWVEMTDIQRAALIPGLQGRDVLGAAKTGSGKTLAFVVPVQHGRRASAHGQTPHMDTSFGCPIARRRPYTNARGALFLLVPSRALPPALASPGP